MWWRQRALRPIPYASKEKSIQPASILVQRTRDLDCQTGVSSQARATIDHRPSGQNARLACLHSSDVRFVPLIRSLFRSLFCNLIIASKPKWNPNQFETRSGTFPAASCKQKQTHRDTLLKHDPPRFPASQ